MNAPVTTPTFPPVTFSITDAGIAELEAKFKGLTVAFGDAKGYAGLVKAIAEIRTTRTDVEKRRKELKQDALDYGRKVDDAAKTITARLEAIEGPLKDQKDEIDAEVARIKAEKAEAERQRVAGIQEKIAAISAMPALCANATAAKLEDALLIARAKIITEEDFGEFAAQAREAMVTAINALDMMLDARLAADKAEAARLAEQARIDAERKAEADRVAAESARLAAERAEFERQQAEARRQQEEADRIRREAERAEAERLDAERKAQQAEIDRQAAALRQQQADFERKQAEAKEAAERAEAAKLAAAEAKKEAKAKAEAEAKLAAEIEAARPDRERVISYVRGVLAGLADVPATGTVIGNHMRADLVEALEGLLVGWGAE